jgi:hypothetical protein
MAVVPIVLLARKGAPAAARLAIINCVASFEDRMLVRVSYGYLWLAASIWIRRTDLRS